MNKLNIKPGVYPTMLTPYNKDGSVDYGAVAAIAEWYIAEESKGIFANCLSSEIDYLTIDEKQKILETIVNTVNKKIPIVASGMGNGELEKQINTLKMMQNSGADAIILIASRMVTPEESEDILKQKTEKIMAELRDIDFGFYECPVPYERQISAEMLKWCADTDRFVFFKDTSCCMEKIKKKLDAVCNSRMKFFNANSASLLDSMKIGAAGISGVMANVHPKWYAELIKAFKNKDIKRAEMLQNIIGGLSIFQYQRYPLNAKYYMKLAGLPIKNDMSRNCPNVVLSETNKREIEQFFEMSKYIDSLI